MNVTEMNKLRKAFQSMLRADYISITDIAKLEKLEEYYVDYLKNVPKVLQDQDMYINGRRGAGKTSLIMRCYFECLKTIISKEKTDIFGSKKVLPIYIDLNQCKEMFYENNGASVEKNFTLYLINELRDIVTSNIFKGGNFFKGKEKEFEKFEELVRKGNEIERTIVTEVSTEKKTHNNGFSINPIKLVGGVEYKDGDEIINKMEISSKYSINSKMLLNFLNDIRIAYDIDSIYVFIDEFSDLSENDQVIFSKLLKKLLGSKNNIYFKIGTITDRFNFGNDIIIGRDIFPIFLDLNDFVENYGGIIVGMKKLENFTKNLIEKRLESYCPEVTINEVFNANLDDIISRITREAMGVPRTIGLVLQKSLEQAIVSDRKVIGISDINVGIQETKKIYFKQFQGAVKKGVIPPYYMDMWNSIIKRALDEKSKNIKKPSSHFMIDQSRKKYLNILCENFILHLLEENRASKYGGSYLLYSIDYAICIENKILFAEEKDQFTPARFIYDSVLSEYDCYFLDEQLKSYKCPDCNRIYAEKEVKKIKHKRCFECDTLLVKVIHKEVPISSGNYTEVEGKILGILDGLDSSEAMSAVDISNAVGCTRQKVSNWCSKVLLKKKLVSIDKRDRKNYYYDYVDQK